MSVNLNVLKLNNVEIEPKRNVGVSQVSFKSNPDSFVKLPKIVETDFSSSLSENAKQAVKDKVANIIQNQGCIEHLGKGATGIVYKIEGVQGFEPYGAVVKISFNKDYDPVTGEKQKVGINYDAEIGILKQVQSLGSASQQYIASMKLDDKRSVLVTSFVSGKNPDPTYNKISSESLVSVLRSLEKLDSACVLHRDLKKENFLKDSDSPLMKIIDYGEAVQIDPLDNAKNNEVHHFPPFELPTNLRNFEDTFLSPYLAELKDTSLNDARELYENYLIQKANLVHTPQANRLRQLLEDNYSSYTPEQINALEDMIDYQEVMAKILAAPDKEEVVIAIELLKNQVTFLTELAYKNEILLGKPLANMFMKLTAQATLKRLQILLSTELKRANNEDMKKYIQYQMENMQYRFGKVSEWKVGLKNWMDICLNANPDTAAGSVRTKIFELVQHDATDFTIPDITKLSPLTKVSYERTDGDL